jgi:hypothetical protein
LRVVEGSANAPPYPPDTTVVASRFPLDLPRLMASDTWTLTAPTPELRPWLLMLWVVSWTQVPAGSFADDDALLAAKIGMPLHAFQLSRGTLMRGWYKATDGRLYHNIISELVLDKLDERAKWRKRHGVPDQTSHRSGTTVHHGGTAVNGDDAAQPPSRTPVDNQSHRGGTARAGAGAGAGAGRVKTLPLGSVESQSFVGKGSGETRADSLTLTAPEAEKPSKRKPATHLPEDWELPEAWKAWAVQVYRLNPQRVVRMSLTFKRYWCAKSGKDATKRDWRMTWENWVAKEVGDA